MKTLYLELGMGAAGDMLAAALLELLPDPSGFIKELNNIGIPGVVCTCVPSVKCGITGTYFKVTVNGAQEESHDVHSHMHGHTHSYDNRHMDEACHAQDDVKSGEVHKCPVHDAPHASGNEGHEHSISHDHTAYDECHTHDHEKEKGSYVHAHNHSSLHDIEHIVRGHLHVSDRVKDDIMAVYGLIAGAESHAHGVPVKEIHFHEVGTMDAIADITAVCMLMERLSPDKIYASPVHVGTGTVRCAHGILPVPAPATACILKDVPVYGGRIEGELCTPTGAALLKHFVTAFGGMPLMKIHKTGYGMGRKDFEQANCVRAFLGESWDGRDKVCVLSCNLDDMTPEEIGFAEEELILSGALDVYTVPIGMKKSRPGVMFSVICREEEKERMAGLIFRHTSTLGIRESICTRYTLKRESVECATKYGTIRKKVSEGYGVTREKPEYDDAAALARAHGLPLRDILSDL